MPARRQASVSPRRALSSSFLPFPPLAAATVWLSGHATGHLPPLPKIANICQLLLARPAAESSHGRLYVLLLLFYLSRFRSDRLSQNLPDRPIFAKFSGSATVEADYQSEISFSISLRDIGRYGNQLLLVFIHITGFRHASS